MSLRLVLCLVVAMCGNHSTRAAINELTDEEVANGWILLFDGETLFGWEPATPANWRVADGTIQVSAGEKGLLHTTSRFSDYLLSLEFRTTPATNSGIFLRTLPVPTDVLRHCYELNIAPADNAFPTGSFVGRQKVENYPLTDGETEWHRYDVLAQKDHFEVRIDGKLVLEYDDPEPIAIGHIGLQLNEGAVAFRDIKLRPLGGQMLLEDRRLDRWDDSLQRESSFSLDEHGVLSVQGGPGQLATRQQFANFILQLDCFVNGDGLNSGVFFRCLPDQYLMGYESQIHNGFLHGDRTQPEDAGSGAIFRRQNARRIVAQDRQWFTKTIHADGPHMAVWVNGYQVTDWTDTRSADPNPRRGRRDAAGTLALQAHDPTTDLKFRRLRLINLP